ncbi:MAG: enoyl-CoA hydratase-related protein [Deltaproteobacteria bacterium]|nr:enoyl-CoA hydratase-related protein [Deltaproteobacteria bacterium]
MSVRVENEGRVVAITLDRPPLNVMDFSLLRELAAALDSCAENPKVDIVVLSGSGGRAFSAGVDIKDHTREKVPEMLQVVHGAMRKLLAMPQVTIARVQGVCLGGGCELATCCDFIIATEDSSFATPEILVGCYPPAALARFTSLIGYRRAADLILTGRSISAAEALSMGLISRVAPKDKLDGALAAIVEDLLGKSASVLRITLKGLRERSQSGFAEALQRSEQIYCDDLLRTEDVEEGVRAFLEKRKPRWTHR